MRKHYTTSSIPDRALELADAVGENLRQLVPAHAGKWFEAGAKVGALRGGARVAGMVVRRNPAVFVAMAAGAGLLWYAAHRRARRAERESEVLEGRSRRVEARRAGARTPGDVNTGVGATGAGGPTDSMH